MSSDNSSPFVVSSKVPPIRHVRLIRNSSLPSLQSLISHPQSKKTYEPLSSQLSGRPKPALPNLPANPPIQNVNAIVAYDTFLDLEPLRVQNPPKLRKLTDSYRISASDVRSKCLTDRTREEISSSITERYKPKIMEARRSAREIPKIANTFREKEMGRKNKSLNRIVTQSIDALPSVVDNENKKTEEDKEDNNNSTELNWESEKEEAVEIRNSTEEDQVTQDMSSMMGRRDTMKTPNGQLLRQVLRKKSVEEDGLTQDMSSVFGRRDTMKTPNNQVLRQVYREKSADQAKCARCKKCEYCISCTKCSVLSQCMDCQTCPRCVKCPKCFERDDLSPTREIKLRNVYFERYKGIEELERKDFLEKNPRDTYLKKCKDQRVLPFPLDLYNEEGKTGKKMEIKFYRLGNERANALASSIGINTDLENIDLTRIGLEGKGIAEILEKLTTNVKSLELTENKLDGVGLTALCMVITNRKYGNLRVLKLEGMGMGEKQGEVLANALIDNSFIKVLNLSRNRLGDRTMVNLAKFIEDSTTIQQLYLHWNNIMSKGCLLLCDSVVKSNTLKVLDVSWNRIGNHYNLSSAEKLAYMFRNNVSVVHLDFSFCGFREQECAIMAEGLLLNHTILGIHMTGNKWMTDDQGFMNRIVDNETSIIKDALWRRIPQHGEKVTHHPKSSKTTGNCWICEGWREVKFVWNTKEKEDADFEPVHIHLSFDNWKGHLMARESSTSWVLYKMCPPGNLQFFFSLRGGEKADLGNYNEAIEKLPESFKLHNAGQTKAPLTQNLTVPAVNMMCVDYFELLVSETLDLAIEKCVPRPKVEVLPVVEDTWRFAKSIFRYFRRDNLDLERRCFEFDFECSRISQIIRIEQELPGVKEELWKIYPKLRITYKYYSSLTPVGEIFSVPLNSYTEFITKTGVVDNKNLALHAIDKNFIATKSFGKNKFIRSPDKALVRYQFMEILVRCAIDKYYLSNCGCSYTEAVAKIVKEITPHCEEFNHEAFRLKRLWNPFCDFMFRSNIGIMRRLYEKYCDHKRKLKGRNTLNLADFYKFCRDARLINVFLYEREPILIFNLAMMTQVDELNYGRHTRMFFVEFLDAFARLADKIIPTPDNPLPDLHDKIGELIKISAIKCLGEEDYHVFSPPDHLRALKIDLSPYPPKEK